ncbi:MAG TPA: tetratricopeptide repeat protein [Anaerolineaceae bacterium]
MDTHLVLEDLYQLFSPQDAQIIVAALREDAMVWDAVQSPEIFHRIFTVAGVSVANWTPSNIAWILLSGGSLPGVLRHDLLTQVNPGIQQRSLVAYEDTLKKGAKPDTLEYACLLAIAMRERRRLTGSWNGLAGELLYKRSILDAIQTWKTPLACLIGIIPDPVELLKSLASCPQVDVIMDWVIHALFANPYPVDERVHILAEFLAGLTVQSQINWLRKLSLSGKKTEVNRLAKIGLSTNGRADDDLLKRNLIHLDSGGVLEFIGEAINRAIFLQYAGENTKAESMLNQALQAAKLALGGLILQKHTIAKTQGSPELNTLLIEIPVLEKEAGISLSVNPNLIKSGDFPNDCKDDVVILYKAYHQFLAGENTAVHLAKECASRIIEKSQNNPNWWDNQYGLEFNPGALVDVLVEMGLYPAARSLVTIFMNTWQSDAALSSACAELDHRANDNPAAQVHGRLAILLAPETPKYHSRMAHYLEDNAEWEKGFNERAKTLELSILPAFEDRLAYARSALHTRRYQLAIDTGNSLLVEYPDCGLIYEIIGVASMEQGNFESGEENLLRASSLLPEQQSIWLSLADLYRRLGQDAKALDTLRGALVTIPDSAEIYSTLADICLDANLPSEALPYLRKADSLTSGNLVAKIKLGRTLRLLGHMDEALQLFENSFANADPQAREFPEFCVEHGVTYLACGNREAALEKFENAIQSGQPQLEWYLLYAQALLGDEGEGGWDEDPERIAHAEQALKKILEIAPDDFKARVLLAEVYHRKGDLKAALQIYNDVINHPLANTVEWSWRVQWGIGQIAYALHQVDTALAALKEASHSRPNHIKVNQMLAEVYIDAHLVQDAIVTARNVLQMAPSSVDNLTWYASQMVKLNRNDEAIGAYNTAFQLDTSNANLLVEMAQLQVKVGDLADARQNLARLNAIDGVTVENMRQAAYTYMRLEDPLMALACLEKAIEIDPASSPALLYETARLYQQVGQGEEALRLVQKAIHLAPDTTLFYVLQAELLANLDRPQAALASLEHALRLMELDQRKAALDADAVLAYPGNPETNISAAEIHSRFAELLDLVGDLKSAYQHAKKAVSGAPLNDSYRYKAASLAIGLLQNDQADQFLEVVESIGESIHLNSYPATKLKEQAVLIALKAELEIEKQASTAEKWVDLGLALMDDLRLKAAKVRVLAQKGDFPSAKMFYAAVIEPFVKRMLLIEVDNSFSQESRGALNQLGWLGEAALAVEEWNDAILLLGKYCSYRATEPRAFLRYARAVTLAAEVQTFCEENGVMVHAPGMDKLGIESERRFDQSIQNASDLGDSPEIDHWRVRGKAIFRPSPQQARGMGAFICNPDDVAAAIAVHRRIKQIEPVAELGARFPEDCWVQVQAALCYLDREPVGGIQIARNIIERCPSQPLFHAALSRLLEKAGDMNGALQAIEAALNIWADEPRWQARAGRLSTACGYKDAAVTHWEKALALRPTFAEFALELGKAYLNVSDFVQAIEVLETASSLEPMSAMIWQALSQAYIARGEFDKAEQSANRMIELDPKNVDAYLMCANIAYQAGDLNRALGLVQVALDKLPENIDAVLFLVKILKQQNRINECLEFLDTHLTGVNRSTKLQLEKADLIRKSQGIEPAVQYLQEMVNENPDDVDVLDALAHMQEESGDLRAAESTAIIALRLDPDRPEINYLLGHLQHKSGQLDQAVYHLSEAIRLDASRLEPFLELGQVYQDRREHLQSLRIYQQAIKVDPEDPRAYYHAALLLREGRDYVGAESMLRKAALLSPEDINIRRQLGSIVALNLVQSVQEVAK